MLAIGWLWFRQEHLLFEPTPLPLDEPLVDDPGVQPLLVGVLARQGGLDLVVGDDAAGEHLDDVRHAGEVELGDDAVAPGEMARADGDERAPREERAEDPHERSARQEREK